MIELENLISDEKKKKKKTVNKRIDRFRYEKSQGGRVHPSFDPEL